MKIFNKNYMLPISLTQCEDYSRNKFGTGLNNPQKPACAKALAGRQASVKEYERQIDQLVYRLYELTDEEIRVVEGDNYVKA
jgi:hypothetical protein